MAQERILIEIVTAANLAGVEAAKKELLGFNVSTLALAAVLFAAIEVGKQAIENYKAQEEALLGLHQATDATKQDYGEMQGAVEDFIQTNQAYISNQYDVMAASAQIVRAGHNETDTLRLLNDALDLSVIKHEDVSAAAKSLILAESGNAKALKELGITTEQYSAIMKDKKLTVEQKDAELLALIESKTKDGKKATDDNAQAQNKLTIAWQTFTAHAGPGIVDGLTQITNALATGVDILNLYLTLLDKANAQYSYHPHAAAPPPPTTKLPTGASYNPARAAGGPVDAGGAYTVGENGPETLVMGGSSGHIMPNGGNHIHIHIDRGAYIDGPGLDMLTNRIAQRLKVVGGL